MIPSQIIEEIRGKADIVKIVSEYVRLRKRGKNYVGMCPFHSEKDPSFTVSPEKQLFHCFGCNEGGNVFAFIMKIENIGFAEAAEELGAKLGIAVPRASGTGPSKNEKDKLYQIMLLATRYFHDCLLDKTGEAARRYLGKRGISDKTINQFHLGYAPPGWDNLFNYLIARGASPAMIEKTGLILSREGKSGYYDRFRNRIIFPIIDHRDRCVAFGGRSLGNEEPKYLNSPDSAIYHKGETVFGLNLSKESIKKCKTAVLVEGYIDLITPYQAGTTNIVATLGTALTVYQCKLLARYSDTVILAFDADSAGGAATERSIELMRNQGLKVKVAELSGGKDPDEVIRNQGEGAFKKCISSALPFLEFKIKRIVSRHDLKEIESRSKALREVAAVLSQQNDHYIQKEYAKLAASMLKADPEELLEEVKRARHYRRGGKESLRRTTEKPASKICEAEKNLIALAAQSKESLAVIRLELSAEDFILPESKAIARLFLTVDFDGTDDLSHFLLNNLPDEGSKKFLSRILMGDHLAEAEKREEILRDCISVIKTERQKNKVEKLKLDIKEAEKAGNTAHAAELLSALKGEIS